MRASTTSPKIDGDGAQVILIGGRIRVLREQIDLSQADLGAAAGVTKAAISAMERGFTKSPTPITLLKIAHRLGVSMEALITGVGLSLEHHAPEATNIPNAPVASRIHTLMNNAGVPRRGRAARLAALCDVSLTAAGKWLIGEARPRPEHAERIADEYGVTTSLILFGETHSADPDATEGEHELIAEYRRMSPQAQEALLATARLMEAGYE